MKYSGQKSNISAVAVAVSFVFLALLTPLSSAPVQPSNATSSSVVWLTSLKAAQDASHRTGKPILVDFSATWCGPCQAMIHDTFPSLAVQPLLKNLICVRVDVDQDQADALQYQVNAIPRILLLTASSTSPKMDVTGYEDPDTFANELRIGLGMPALPGSAGPSQPVAASPADTVAGALASNSYAQLKAKNKVVAVQGLRDLVAQLGDPPDAQINPIQPNILARAGSDANAALISAMGSSYLSERVGAYAMYQHLHPNVAGAPLYDPWSSTPSRKKQLVRLATWSNKLK